MKLPPFCLALGLLFLPLPNLYAQHLISIGAKVGVGPTASPINPLLNSNGNGYDMRTNGHFTTGVTAQYLIGNRIGMESGMNLNCYTFNLKSDPHYSLTHYFGINPTIQVFDYQIPVQLMYKIELPRNLYKHIKLVGGTSIDWLTTLVNSRLGHALSLKNIMIGARLGKETLKRGRMEYAVEYQYSLRRFNLNGVNYDQLDDTLNARLSMLCVSYYYFFINRDVHKL
jgi:hypothetical protein